METKTCTTCNKSKDLNEFNFRNKKKGTHQCWCRGCQSIAKAQHYSNNKQIYIAKAVSRKARVKAALFTELFEYFKGHPCIDCGESDPIVLHSDHVRGKKKSGISNMIVGERPWSEILEELRKCDTRCANCHSRRTAKQQGWYKHVASSSNG